MKVVVDFSRFPEISRIDIESFLPETPEDEILKKFGEGMLLKYHNGLSVKTEAPVVEKRWKRMEADAIKYEDSIIAIVTCYDMEKNTYRVLVKLGGCEYRNDKLRKIGLDAFIEVGNAVLGFGEVTGVL